MILLVLAVLASLLGVVITVRSAIALHGPFTIIAESTGSHSWSQETRLLTRRGARSSARAAAQIDGD